MSTIPSEGNNQLDLAQDQNGHSKQCIPSSQVTGNTSSDSSSISPDDESQLAPADHGKAAWLFLFGCFWLEGFVWGFPYSYGVFEKYYSNHELFSSESGIGAIGSTGMGLAFFLSPLLTSILQRWPSHRKLVSVLGLVMLTLSLILASFATHVIHLVFTQGLLYGVGGAFVYNPFLFYLDEWFVERKGLAFGIFWAGTGIFGSITPFIMDWALNAYGFRTTLRTWAVVVFVTLAVLIYFVRPRKPLSAKGYTQRLDLSFLQTPLYWAFEIGNIIEGFSYFIPQTYLPTFAQTIPGLSPVSGILSVSLLNISATAGLILMGFLTDRYHISNVLLLSAVTSTLSVFLLWSFAINDAVLYLFAITFGISAGGYTASWVGCASEVKKQNLGAEMAVIMGSMAAGRGVGCVAMGPISESLLRLPKWNVSGVYGTNFGTLILLTGLTSLFGRFGLFGRCGLYSGKGAHEDSVGDGSTRDEREPLLR